MMILIINIKSSGVPHMSSLLEAVAFKLKVSTGKFQAAIFGLTGCPYLG